MARCPSVQRFALGLIGAALCWLVGLRPARAENPDAATSSPPASISAPEIAPAAVPQAAPDEAPVTRSVVGSDRTPEPLPRPAAAPAADDTALPLLLEAEDPPVLETAVQGFDGMLLDESFFGEMPFPASSSSWFWNGGWYVGGESLWMDRSRNNRRVMLRDIPAVPPNRIPLNYTTGDNQFDIAPGGRVTIGRQLERDALNRDRALEFVWYGGMNWEDNANYNTLPGGIFISPLNPLVPGFNGGTRVQTFNTSDFNSWEWNFRVRRRLGRDQLIMGPNGDWSQHTERGWLPGLLVGVRLAHVNESFSMLMTRPGTPTSDFRGVYDIGTSNWLLGLNLGSELISQNEFFYWGLRGRAAPALSFASQSQFANGIDRTGPTARGTNFSDSGSQNFAGFIGDMTFMAGWHLTPNFALQVGYDLLWVAGIATYERQYNLNNTQYNDIDAGGQTFYQGISFGFLGSW